MNFQELRNSIPDAMFYYFDIGEEMIHNLPHPAWWGQTRGIIYCGTLEPVEALADKEVKPE